MMTATVVTGDEVEGVEGVEGVEVAAPLGGGDTTIEELVVVVRAVVGGMADEWLPPLHPASTAPAIAMAPNPRLVRRFPDLMLTGLSQRQACHLTG